MKKLKKHKSLGKPKNYKKKQIFVKSPVQINVSCKTLVDNVSVEKKLKVLNLIKKLKKVIMP